jgi:hypothetical protein
LQKIWQAVQFATDTILWNTSWSILYDD